MGRNSLHVNRQFAPAEEQLRGLKPMRSAVRARRSLLMDQSGIWLWALPVGWLTAFVFQWPFLLVYFLISIEEPLKSLLAL